MPNNKKEENKALEINTNPSLPNNWIDMINLALRDDNICILRFFAKLPEGIFEQTRVTTTKEVIINFTEILCKNLDYYPKKKITVKKRKPRVKVVK